MAGKTALTAIYLHMPNLIFWKRLLANLESSVWLNISVIYVRCPGQFDRYSRTGRSRCSFCPKLQTNRHGARPAPAHSCSIHLAFTFEIGSVFDVMIWIMILWVLIFFKNVRVLNAKLLTTSLAYIYLVLQHFFLLEYAKKIAHHCIKKRIKVGLQPAEQKAHGAHYYALT